MLVKPPAGELRDEMCVWRLSHGVTRLPAIQWPIHDQRHTRTVVGDPDWCVWRARQSVLLICTTRTESFEWQAHAAATHFERGSGKSARRESQDMLRDMLASGRDGLHSALARPSAPS